MANTPTLFILPQAGQTYLLQLNAGDELCQEHQVQDDGSGQERVFAGVVDDQGVAATLAGQEKNEGSGGEAQ